MAWTTRFKQRNRALSLDPIPDHRRVYDAIVAAAMSSLVTPALADTHFDTG